MPIRACLTKYEVELYCRLGEHRARESKEKGFYQSLPDGDEENKDRHAMCAEGVVAKYLDLYPRFSVNNFGASWPDVGWWEVKHTHRHDHRLLIKKKAQDFRRYILVTGVIPEFLIHGWIEGYEAKREEWYGNWANKGWCYWVPRYELTPFLPLDFALETGRLTGVLVHQPREGILLVANEVQSLPLLNRA